MGDRKAGEKTSEIVLAPLPDPGLILGFTSIFFRNSWNFLIFKLMRLLAEYLEHDQCNDKLKSLSNQLHIVVLLGGKLALKNFIPVMCQRDASCLKCHFLKPKIH